VFYVPSYYGVRDFLIQRVTLGIKNNEYLRKDLGFYGIV
jgi:hypothetical protein